MSDIGSIDKYFDLDGKVALITGGSRGLGLHTATVFLKAGARKVIICARKAEGSQGIDQAVVKLNALANIKGIAVGLTANVAQEDGILKLVDEVKKTEQSLHILVANAGATYGGPFESTPDSFIAKVLDLNVRGVFNLVKICTPLLENAGTARDPARVIVVSSIAGTEVPHTGKNGTIIYSVSKAAAHHLTRNLAVELGPRNITVNTVAPGFFPSKLANGIIAELGGEEELRKENPRGRLGIAEDIAGAMLFLASPVANYINGIDIKLDGGNHLVHGLLAKM